MEKTLFKIVKLTNDGICGAEIHTDDKEDMARICASLCSLMDRQEAFAQAVLQATYLYFDHREELKKVNEAAIRGAEIKMTN